MFSFYYRLNKNHNELDIKIKQNYNLTYQSYNQKNQINQINNTMKLYIDESTKKYIFKLLSYSTIKYECK